MTNVPEDIASALDILKRWRPDIEVDVHWSPSVASTMDVAQRRAAEGAPAGLVIGADEQTAGRGRRGSTWYSPPGDGLYFSWLCRPSLEPSDLPMLTLAAGVAVRRGIEKAEGLSADLKWPNDVLIRGRKLAGILAEGVALGTPEQAVIVGVGINLRHGMFPGDVAPRATSLEIEVGWPPDRAQVLIEVLCGLVDAVAEMERDRDAILRAWREAAPSAVGASVEFTTTNGQGRGVTAGVDDHGALLVQTGGAVERIVAGEIRWLT